MTEDHDIADTAIAHGGWIAAALVATWGWILKRAQGDIGKILQRIEDGLREQGERIARIEGRLGINEKNHP